MAATLQTKKALVIEVAKQVFLTAIDNHACVALIETGNNESVWRKLTRQGADRAAKIIRVSLFMRLVIQTMREFAPVRPNDYHLRVGIDLLQEQPILDYFSSRGCAANLQDAINSFKLLESDERLKRLMHMRNKNAAHLSATNPNIPKPQILDVETFVHDLGCLAEISRTWHRYSYRFNY